MNATADIPSLSLTASALDELMPQLLQLNANTRLEIIARLSQSLQSAPAAAVENKAPVKASLLDFAGAWADMPGTDAEIIADIRAARTFTRPDISLH